MDDGDDCDTREMIQREYPEVHYHQLGVGRGPAFQRNRGIELASTNFVFPVDDDTLFVSPHTIEQTLAEFDHPRVGAVGMPYINVKKDQKVLQRAPGEGGAYVTYAFVGAAHCVRRDVFLGVGGYREHFFYMGEEGDLCLRMLEAGYVTRLGRADVMHHFESPNRNSTLADWCGRRNDVLFVWHNAPATVLPAHMLATTYLGLCHALRVSRLPSHIRGSLSGWRVVLTGGAERRPVTEPTYRIFRRLKKGGPLLLTDIEGCLPSLKC
jgi:GT2 family glycosyltransferase